MHRSLFVFLSAACALLPLVTTAYAQNYQTWVSATGTDQLPCDAAAPCRTFQFAASQTQTRGVINVLNSGDYGPLTINRSISIIADGAEAGIFSHANGSAIRITGNAIDVLLRGLTIDLFQANKIGIDFQKGTTLHIDRTTIRGTSIGVKFAANLGTNELLISDSLITFTVGEGIVVSPAAGSSAKVAISRSRVQNAGSHGILFDSTGGGINATVADSVSAGHLGSGITGIATPMAPLNVMVDRTSSVNNSSAGIEANGGFIRIGDSTVSGNNTGLVTLNGGTIASYGTNKVNGNFPGGDGAPTSTIAHK